MPDSSPIGIAPRLVRTQARMLACGSVDDGKSTLIGRMLLDANLVPKDVRTALERDSKKYGTTGGLDPALLTDGLQAEREQGITIDVSYRYFATPKRAFILADVPGHEQYTRNMVTAASLSDVAIVLIDAARGVQEQTRRHATICAMLGIEHVIVAVNKMDLVSHAQAVFDAIRADFSGVVARLGIRDIRFVPVCAVAGDNVVHRSTNMPWYEGEPLLSLLETVHIASDQNLVDFRFPIQSVCRTGTYRGYRGTVASGVVRLGDEVMVLPSRTKSRVHSINLANEQLPQAFAQQAVTITLENEVDVSRGDVLLSPQNLTTVSRFLEMMFVWMDNDPLVPGRDYLIKHLHSTTNARVTAIRYVFDVNTGHRVDAATLTSNAIGRCAVETDIPLLCDGYERNRVTGSCILIDRKTGATVAAGMLLERSVDELKDAQLSSNMLRHERSALMPEERSMRYRQRPVTILLTGLSGAGKSTVALALEERLFRDGYTAVLLDGENMRLGLTSDLGFGEAARQENVRRTMEVARILNDAGLIALCALVAPTEAMRTAARERIGHERFMVMHLDAPVDVCEKRHRKGLYAALQEGAVYNVPGKTAVYEPPVSPDLRLLTADLSPEQCVEHIVALLHERGLLL